MSERKSQATRHLVAMVVLPGALAACGLDAAPRAQAESDPADRPAATAPRGQEADLPAAIVGRGTPPRGEDTYYVPGDSTTRGYLSLPDGDGPFPALILVHEWNGLVDRVRQVADALADEGYVALAADLYHSQVGTSRQENMSLMRAAQGDPDAIIANLDAAARFLRSRPDVTGKVAAMGWCFGGGVALSYAIGGENHEGTAIFYGRLLDDPERLASINHAVYGTFAEMDVGIPPEQVGRFASALRDAGIENDIHIYDDVDHGFWLWVERDPENAPGPAADAWRRLKAYLERVLG
jgi:carboxymethylenebutenolidase